MTRITNTLNTGLAAGTAVTAANSGSGGAGTAFTWVDIVSPSTLTFQSAQRYGASGLSIQLDQSTTSGAALFDFEGVGLTGKTWAFRYYIYLTQNPSNIARVHTMYNASDAEVSRMSITSGRQLQLRTSANAILATSTALALNTWYRVEVSITAGTTTANGVVTAQVYTLDTATSPLLNYSSNAQNTGTADLGYLRMGRDSGGLTLDAYFDEFAMDDALAGALIGPVGGWPATTHPVSGSVPVVSTLASPSLNAIFRPSGTVAAVSALSGAVTQRSPVSGAVPVVSTVSGDADRVGQTFSVSGTVPIVSTVAGAAVKRAPAAGVVPVASTISGAAVRRTSVSGSVAVISTVSGDATTAAITYDVSGTVDVTSGATGDMAAILLTAQHFGLDTIRERDLWRSGISAAIDLVPGAGIGGRDALVSDAALAHRQHIPLDMRRPSRTAGDVFEVSLYLDTALSTTCLGGIALARATGVTGYQFLIDHRNGPDGTSSASMQVRMNGQTSNLLGSERLTDPPIQSGVWYRLRVTTNGDGTFTFDVFYEGSRAHIGHLVTEANFDYTWYTPGLYAYGAARFQDFDGLLLGQSGSSGDAVVIQGLSGTVDVVSTVSGEVLQRSVAAGTVPIVSTVAGNAVRRASTAGAVGVLSGTGGTVTSRLPTQGVVAVSSGTSGTVARRQTVGGSVAAVTGVAGSVASRQALSGEVSVISGTSGDAVGRLAVSGEVEVVSSVSGSATPPGGFEGTVEIESTVSGQPTGRFLVSGVVGVVAGVIGTVHARRRTQGTTPIVSTITGNAVRQTAVAGTVGVVSSVEGGPILILPAAGLIAAMVETAGSVTVIQTAEGVVPVTSVLVGDATMYLPLAGTVTVVTTVSGNVIVYTPPVFARMYYRGEEIAKVYNSGGEVVIR